MTLLKMYHKLVTKKVIYTSTVNLLGFISANDFPGPAIYNLYGNTHYVN